MRLTIPDLDDMLARLAELPGKIEENSRIAADLKQQKAQLQSEIDEFKWTQDFEVRSDKDTYKNEAARESAIRMKVQADPGVQRRQKEIADLDAQETRVSRLVWQLKDEFTVTKYRIRATVAVIEGLTDPLVKEIICGNKQAPVGERF